MNEKTEIEIQKVSYRTDTRKNEHSNSLKTQDVETIVRKSTEGGYGPEKILFRPITRVVEIVYNTYSKAIPIHRVYEMKKKKGESE